MKFTSILTATTCIAGAALTAQAGEFADAFLELSHAIDGVTASLKLVTDSDSVKKNVPNVAAKAKLVAVAGKKLEEISARLSTASQYEQEAAQREMLESIPTLQKSAEALNTEIERLKNSGLLSEGSELHTALKNMEAKQA